MKFAKASLAVLILQLAIVSTVAAKFFYQRATCPRVWTRAVGYDPTLIMRGRYLSLQLMVDGCGTLSSAKEAQFPPSTNPIPAGRSFPGHSADAVWFEANLTVRDNKLEVIRIPESGTTTSAQSVAATPGEPCDQMRLAAPVDFYIPEHATDPSMLERGQQLWIEVTVPPKGPPRPLQLALKDHGQWKPLAFE